MIDKDEEDAIVGRVITQLAAEGRTCPTDPGHICATVVFLNGILGMSPERTYATALFVINQLDADGEMGTDSRPPLV
jgi:hypothetical protein